MPLTVSVIAPASYTDPHLIDEAVATLASLGIHAQLPESLQAPQRYLAGNVQHRLESLYAAYADPSTQAVWAVRGGYGCAQLIGHIDWERLSQKPLIGYSDITVLLDQCYRHGLPAIHGPVLKDALRLSDESAEQREITRAQLDELVGLVEGRSTAPFALKLHGDQTVIERPIEGPVVGGNLMTMACVAGTAAQFIAPAHSIVTLEDVGEPFYRLERAMWQLVHAGAFDDAAAVCLGTFEGCSAYGEQSLVEIFTDVLRPLNLPLYTGLDVGHGARNRPWRYGASARIEGEQLVFTEPDTASFTMQ